MCGRTALTLDREKVVRKCSGLGRGESSAVPVWEAAPCGGEFHPSPNISPSLYTPVLYRRRQDLVVQPMMWGLVPPTHPGPRPTSHGLSTNNCRLETVRTSGLYSPSLTTRRCVVLCQGFYEWQRSGGRKQPYLVYRGGEEQPLLYMAGLYSVWRGEVVSYTIITRQSNSVLSWLHHRMPAFLQPTQVWDWLDPTNSPDQALALLHLPSPGDLVWHKVSSKVGNSRNQDSNLMEKVEDKPGPVSGIMSNWLKSKTDNSEETPVAVIEKPQVKKKSEKNPIMTNWLKRGRSDIASCDKPCNEEPSEVKSIKLS